MFTLQITWDRIFPKNIQNNLITTIATRNPNYLDSFIHDTDNQTTKSHKSLYNKKSLRKQKILFRMIVPKEYRIMPNQIDMTDDMIPNQFSRFFKYTNNYGFKYYEHIKKQIIKEAKNGNYNFHSLPFINALSKNLKELFSFLEEETLTQYKTNIKTIIDEMNNTKGSILEGKLADLSKAEFLVQITCLTTIASVWACLENIYDRNDLLPFITPNNTPKTNEKNWILPYIAEQKAKSQKLFSKALTLFSQQKYVQAAEKFEDITRHNFANDNVLGASYYYLFLCYQDHKDIFAHIQKANSSTTGKYTYSRSHLKDILQKACDYGNPDALKRFQAEYSNNFRLIRPISEAHGSARIILNCLNEYTEEFFKSLPIEMQDEKTQKDLIKVATDRQTFIHVLHNYPDSRFLLLDDSAEKNFQNLLFILEEILPNNKKNAFLSLKWYETIIYIRVPEEKYSALIDTALKRLKDYTIQVFIIDDCKKAAQQLLFNYPLFIPIAKMPANKLQSKPVTINFNIISKGNMELTKWLVREAFWMGCFHYSMITLKINIISPDADLIEKSLRLNCPDIFGDVSKIDGTSKVEIRTICVKNLSSPEIFQKIELLNEQDNDVYNYYVVNISSDIDNLNFAIKIREWNIRNIIKSGEEPQKNNLPVIAFYCQNTDIAHLSNHLIIQAIDSGNQWFNNYNLVPFGTLHDRYSWLKIDGGYLEKMAQSTHLQYSSVEISAESEKKIEHLKDYFSRCYNRDSSMAVALSMPYRLFQTKTDTSSHIVPCENYDHLSDASIQVLANSFNKAIESKENQEDLLRYEHSRWLRWAISRGWQSATPDEVLTYMAAGNPKQQLYVARMHGCITSLNNLNLLSEALKNYATQKADKSNWERYASERKPIYSETDTRIIIPENDIESIVTGEKRTIRKSKNIDIDRKYILGYTYTPKDFIKIDKSNIKQTGDIITLAWFSDNIRNEQKDI